MYIDIDIHGRIYRYANTFVAIHCASSNGYTQIMEMLASDNEKVVSMCDKYGCTPLFYAASHNRLPALRSLLKSGADPNHQDSKGRRSVPSQRKL